MTTGALSFPGGSSAEIFKAILDASPVPALRLNPAVPPVLERKAVSETAHCCAVGRTKSGFDKETP